VDGLLDGLVVGCVGLVGCLVAWCRLGGLLSCLRLLEKHAGHDHEALGCSGKTKKQPRDLNASPSLLGFPH